MLARRDVPQNDSELFTVESFDFPLSFYYDNDYMMAKSQNAFRRAAFAAQQNSTAVLSYIHCNEHRANDSMNHSLPNLLFGSEINRIVD